MPGIFDGLNTGAVAGKKLHLFEFKGALTLDGLQLSLRGFQPLRSGGLEPRGLKHRMLDRELRPVSQVNLGVSELPAAGEQARGASRQSDD